MKKLLALLSLSIVPLAAQSRWAATTGDATVSGTAYAATIQQPASNQAQVALDQIVIYCSVACVATQAVNGTAATTTAGTILPILPSTPNTPINLNFFTASNVGAGTTQGGLLHIVAGSTVTVCFSPSCGNPTQVMLPSAGTLSNYSVSLASFTGTANITFYGRSSQ